MRDMFSIFRQDMSYNPGVDIRKCVIFQITTTRVRPGHDAQYVDYVQKVMNAAREKAKVDNLHIAAFPGGQWSAGGTYMIMRPMKSLADLDDAYSARFGSMDRRHEKRR